MEVLGNKFFHIQLLFMKSQGRFAEYINSFISNPDATTRPLFSEGLVPGKRKSKRI